MSESAVAHLPARPSPARERSSLARQRHRSSGRKQPHRSAGARLDDQSSISLQEPEPGGTMNRHGWGARWHRRQILAAAGSAALLPLLPNYSGAAGPLGRPTRLLLAFHPNGLEEGWQPGGSDDLIDLG